MDIEVNRIINDPNGTLIKNGRISLSDEMILAIGKRYFELASGKDKPKEPVIFDNPTYCPVPVTDDLLKELKEQNTKTPVDIVEAAYAIKEYCRKRMCPGCPFSYQTTSSDLLYKCCLRNDDEASITPEKWQLPPKEV